MDTESEPIRITNWITAVIGAFVGGAIMYLQTNDWRAAAIAVLTAAGPLVAAAEVARQKVVSPKTLEDKLNVTVAQLK